MSKSHERRINEYVSK